MLGHLETSVDVAAPIDDVFAFFSNPANLSRLTPPSLKFEILTPQPIEMRVGALIDYRLRVRGIPMRWQSEITRWEPGRLFTDTQKRGPYKTWVHTHGFEAVPGGTRVTDTLDFELPGGPIGRFVLPLVTRDVKRIFAYREQTLTELFPRLGPESVGVQVL